MSHQEFRVAIVTGDARGIGAGIVSSLGDVGLSVAVLDMDGDAAKVASDDHLADPVTRIPVRRAGRPEDGGALAAFLPGDAAGFITGQVITVSGGA